MSATWENRLVHGRGGGEKGRVEPDMGKDCRCTGLLRGTERFAAESRKEVGGENLRGCELGKKGDNWAGWSSWGGSLKKTEDS